MFVIPFTFTELLLGALNNYTLYVRTLGTSFKVFDISYKKVSLKIVTKIRKYEIIAQAQLTITPCIKEQK